MINRWAAAAGAIGALALFGWAAHIPAATSLLPTWPAMRPITASWLVLLAVGLLWPVGAQPRATPIFCCALVVAAASITLVQFTLNLGPVLDYLLFGDQIRLQPGITPGRATPHVAMAALLLAISIALGQLRARAAITEALALGASLIPIAGLLGYILQTRHLDLTGAGANIGMAASTGMALLIVANGVLARATPGGVREFLAGSGAAAQLVRRLLAPIMLLPVIVGALLIRTTTSGRLDYPFNVAVGLACIGMALAYLTLHLADRINEQEMELAYRARYDALTGVANRATFTELVTQSLTREGHRAAEVGILYVDVDDFKAVNDTLGHADGDTVLRSIAEKLLNATRGIDVVGRLGGDEFAILMRNVQADSDMRVVAERALAAFAEPVPLRATQFVVSATIGIARATPGMQVDELTRNADLAMYRAKHLGKGRYEVFVPELYDDDRERQSIDAELRSAIHRNELRLHYQPVVDLQSGVLVGVEALVRWQHPQRGLLPPAAFIAAAEQSGAIVPMGRWVVKEGCRQAAEWMREGMPPGFTLAINVSARQLNDATLVEDVRSALAESGIEPMRLVLEITETAIMSNLEAMIPVLHQFKALGIRLAIDDFGTGYSSLSYLQRLPIDILKIDKSFVEGVTHGGIDRALARTIVALSETLSLQTIAEGVETLSQSQHLGDIGCIYGQGHHFSHAVPGDEISRQLDDQRHRLVTASAETLPQ